MLKLGTRLFIIIEIISLGILSLYGAGFNNYINSYPINSPYTQEAAASNTLFTNFNQPPKHLDPARSYSSDEYIFVAQIYEPIYQYHYLLRPYQLEPLSAESVSEQYYQNLNKTVFTIKLKNNIRYQPHPAFIKDKNNNFVYHSLDQKILKNIDCLADFNYLDLSDSINTPNTRELIADDFAYQIKRLADPKNQSPIYGFMSRYIIGLDKLNAELADKRKSSNDMFLNLSEFKLEGVKVLDNNTFEIHINGKYPQFKYWLAMPFFSPLPWEVDKFYTQEVLKQKNISLDTYPVGTGPYMLTENNPNRRMVLAKNPYYQQGYYPSEGMPEDKEQGLMDKAGQKLPFIDNIVFSLERESIPIWSKFLQGYYDTAGISSDNFDQVIDIVNNNLELSPEMQEKNIKLLKTIEPSIFYWSFNMLDKTVGGYSEKQRKLRQAITIAFDIEEYIQIFRNGRGIVAHSPIPPGLTNDNSNTSFNQYIYKNKLDKKDLIYAKQLLNEAGYEDGIDVETGDPLVINFDAVSSGNPSEGAVYNWMREQFEKLNIKLNISVTQYNRFREKINSGTSQMFMWGWNADYPDPENFLFLFLCSQSKVNNNGENASNYCNKEYDDLFMKMQISDDENNKQTIISNMVAILQNDNPWIFGYYDELFQLKHSWMDISKPLAVGNNNIKYLSLDSAKRLSFQTFWNKPKLWPMVIFLVIFILLIVPVVISYYKKINTSFRKRLI